MESDLVDGAKLLPPPPKLPDITTSHIILTIEKVSNARSETTASASNCHR